MNPTVEVITSAGPAWWTTALQSLSGVVVGGALAVFGQKLTDKRSENREAAKIAADLTLQDNRAWKQLQLESLVTVQSALNDLVTVYIRYVVLRGEDHGTGEGLETLSTKVMVYTSRLSDRRLASDINDFSSDLGERGAASHLTLEEYRKNYHPRLVGLNERLGIAIRNSSELKERNTLPDRTA